MYFIASSFLGMVAYETNGNRRNRQLEHIGFRQWRAGARSRLPSRTFAAAPRERLDAGIHKTIATLRADGSPRISGIETMLAEDDLWVGSMPGARKAADLQRDPRYALHGASTDPPELEGRREAPGRAEEIADPDERLRIFRTRGSDPPDADAQLFRLDIKELVLTGLNDAARPARDRALERRPRLAANREGLTAWDTIDGAARRSERPFVSRRRAGRGDAGGAAARLPGLGRGVAQPAAGAGRGRLSRDRARPRGFGESDKPEGVDKYGLALLVGDVLGLMDALEIQRAHIVGHDWGAFLSWVLAALAPDRVDRLAVLSVGHPNSWRRASQGVDQRSLSWYMSLFNAEGLAEEVLARDDWKLFREFVGDATDVERYVSDLGRPGALTAGLNWYRANASTQTIVSGDWGQVPPVAADTLGVWSSGESVLRPGAGGGVGGLRDGHMALRVRRRRRPLDPAQRRRRRQRAARRLPDLTA